MLGDRLTVGHLPLTQTVQVRILVAQPIVSAVERTEIRSLHSSAQTNPGQYGSFWMNGGATQPLDIWQNPLKRLLA